MRTVHCGTVPTAGVVTSITSGTAAILFRHFLLRRQRVLSFATALRDPPVTNMRVAISRSVAKSSNTVTLPKIAKDSLSSVLSAIAKQHIRRRKDVLRRDN